MANHDPEFGAIFTELGISDEQQAKAIAEANARNDAAWEEQQRPAARLQVVYDFDKTIGELFDEQQIDKPTWEAGHQLVNKLERILLGKSN